MYVRRHTNTDIWDYRETADMGVSIMPIIMKVKKLMDLHQCAMGAVH